MKTNSTHINFLQKLKEFFGNFFNIPNKICFAKGCTVGSVIGFCLFFFSGILADFLEKSVKELPPLNPPAVLVKEMGKPNVLLKKQAFFAWLLKSNEDLAKARDLLDKKVLTLGADCHDVKTGDYVLFLLHSNTPFLGYIASKEQIEKTYVVKETHGR